MRRMNPWGVRIGAALVAIALPTVLLPAVVGAERAPRTQSIADLRSQAAKIAADLDAMDMKTSQLDERFNDASIELQQLNDQMGQTKTQVDAAKAAFDTNRQLAKQYAINAFVGTADDGTQMFGSGDPESDGRRSAYLTALHGNREQIVESVTASRKDLQDRQTSLDSAKQAVDSKMSQISSAKKDLNDTIARRKQLLDSINGDLAAAVEAEQARLAAAAAAKAEADARAAAARAAAARRPAAVVTQVSSSAGGPVSIRSLGVATPSGENNAAPSGPPASPPPADAPVAVRAAMAQQGKPYVWAASGPNSFDCSGLMLYAYAQAGISLPHSSAAIRAMTQRISADQLQPGDFIFGGSPVHHVGMYIGNGQMVHAPHSGTNVQVSSMYGTSSPVSFGRL